ncbi:hypothetical protein SLS62_008095 [Diatrype stigma]|uniref:Glycosyltransferase family 32 protein n=1 Tax=Diatrype stigma TaxID=117547 RepID=A0AAN9UN90_9PEZI
MPALTTTIPQKIWYKLGPKGLSDEIREWSDSCIDKNPTYHPEFLTDSSSDEYVIKIFASYPELVESYIDLTVPILKADLLRYLLLYSEGGIWFDLDVSCEDVPIDEWIPPEYKDHVGLVLGWEFDVGWGDTFTRQFASWTMMAKPGLPHMWMVVEDILEGIRAAMAQHQVPVAGLTLAMVGEVVDFTGPRRLTRSVFKSLEQTFNTTVDYESISNLLAPKMIGDLLIMPGYAFAGSSNTYEDEDKARMGPSLVKHHYAGTWKNSHGGEEG